MKQHRFEGAAGRSGGQTATRRVESAGDDSAGRPEHLLDALRDCLGIANGGAGHEDREPGAPNDRHSASEPDPVAALLRRPLR